MAEQLSDDQVRAQFPAYAWLLNIPEIRDILSDPQYVNNAQAASQIQARIEGSRWWQTTEPSLRTYEQLQAQDPEGLAQQQRQKEADIWDMYLKVGLTPNQSDVQSLATQALQHNWNNSQLNDSIVSHATYSPQLMQQAGGIQSNASALKQAADQYGVVVSDEKSFEMARSIAAGEHTLQDYTPYFQGLAQAAYEPWAEQIKAGMTTQQLADPYLQQAAQLYEASPSSINLFKDPKYANVLFKTDPTTGKQQLNSLTQSAAIIRSTDQFKHGTQQGQQMASSLAEGLMNEFGLVSSGARVSAGGQ